MDQSVPTVHERELDGFRISLLKKQRWCGGDTAMKRNLPKGGGTELAGHCRGSEAQLEQGHGEKKCCMEKLRKKNATGQGRTGAGTGIGMDPLYGGVPTPIRQLVPWRGHKNPTGGESSGGLRVTRSCL